MYAPTTGAIETNEVTDPYSVALTINSRALGRDRPARQGLPAQGLGEDRRRRSSTSRSTARSTSCTSATSRSPTSRCPRPSAARTRRSPAGQRRHDAARAARRGRHEHRAPAAVVRHRDDRGGPRRSRPCPTATSSRSAPARSRAAGLHRGGRRRRRRSTGATTRTTSRRPEGSYAVDPNGGARVAEFRSMVGALHEHRPAGRARRGLQPHGAVGPGATSVLDQVVPGYYHRLNATGGGGDIHLLPERRDRARGRREAHGRLRRHVGPRLQGRRLPLRPDGAPLEANMLAVRAALDELTLKKDGVDGKAIYLYGEGWNFGEVANNAPLRAGHTGPARRHRHRHLQRPSARRRARRQPRRERLDDRAGLRHRSRHRSERRADAARPTGLRDLAQQTDLVKLGLAGNLRDFEFDGLRRHGEGGRRGRLQRRRRPATPTSPTRSSTTSTRTTTRRCTTCRCFKLPDRHVDGRPGAHEHGVAGDGDALADAVVLARGHRAAALQVAGSQQLQLRRLVQPHRLDGPGVDVRLGPADRGRQRGEVGDHEAAARRTRRSSPVPPTSPRPRHPLSTCCACATRSTCCASARRT